MKLKKKNFFAMIARMKYINRWGLMRNTIKENIAEHSLDVALIAHGLAVISNIYFDGHIDAERVAVLAMFHDATEIITGDMPTPIKYFAPEIKNAYKNVESVAAKQLISGLPKEMRYTYEDILTANPEEKKLWTFVKAADKLSAYIKCIEEMRMGNTDFEQAKISTFDAVKAMNMPEVDYFLDNFMDSYSLTIDEVTKSKNEE
ncbi:MAG: 5'-deoxynucleotidase [Clostridiales bacterium]|nr:5'-deoxynucleotidase [Clostridiales bacterium]